MVLADAEDIEADLVGKLDLLEEVAQPPRRVGLGPYVGEGVEAKFHRRFLSGRVRLTRTFGAVQAPGGRTRTISCVSANSARCGTAGDPTKRYHELSEDGVVDSVKSRGECRKCWATLSFMQPEVTPVRWTRAWQGSTCTKVHAENRTPVWRAGSLSVRPYRKLSAGVFGLENAARRYPVISRIRSLMRDEPVTTVEREALLRPIVSVSNLAKTYASGFRA